MTRVGYLRELLRPSLREQSSCAGKGCGGLTVLNRDVQERHCAQWLCVGKAEYSNDDVDDRMSGNEM